MTFKVNPFGDSPKSDSLEERLWLLSHVHDRDVIMATTAWLTLADMDIAQGADALAREEVEHALDRVRDCDPTLAAKVSIEALRRYLILGNWEDACAVLEVLRDSGDPLGLYNYAGGILWTLACWTYDEPLARRVEAIAPHHELDLDVQTFGPLPTPLEDVEWVPGADRTALRRPVARRLLDWTPLDWSESIDPLADGAADPLVRVSAILVQAHDAAMVGWTTSVREHLARADAYVASLEGPIAGYARVLAELGGADVLTLCGEFADATARVVRCIDTYPDALIPEAIGRLVHLFRDAVATQDFSVVSEAVSEYLGVSMDRSALQQRLTPLVAGCMQPGGLHVPTLVFSEAMDSNLSDRPLVVRTLFLGHLYAAFGSPVQAIDALVPGLLLRSPNRGHIVTAIRSLAHQFDAKRDWHALDELFARTEYVLGRDRDLAVRSKDLFGDTSRWPLYDAARTASPQLAGALMKRGDDAGVVTTAARILAQRGDGWYSGYAELRCAAIEAKHADKLDQTVGRRIAASIDRATRLCVVGAEGESGLAPFVNVAAWAAGIQGVLTERGLAGGEGRDVV